MASRTILAISFFLAIVAVSDARDFLVSGSADGWKVPSSSSSDVLNKWAEANRFQVGDSLVFKFNGAEDSVLEVTREDYHRCNTASPITTYKEGGASVRLPRSGAYYFISGAPGSCEKGERVVVVVMSERHALRGHRHGGHAPAPAPVAGHDGPAAAPTSGAQGRVVLGAGALLGAVLGVVVFGF